MRYEVFNYIWDDTVYSDGGDYYARVGDDDKRLLPEIWRKRAFSILPALIDNYGINANRGVFVFVEPCKRDGHSLSLVLIHFRLFYEGGDNDIFVDGYIDAMLDTTQQDIAICRVRVKEIDKGIFDYKAEFCRKGKGAAPLLTILGCAYKE